MTHDVPRGAGIRSDRRRILTTYWDGGGNVPPQRALARELVRRGHEVHVLTHNSLAAAVKSDGAIFHRLATAPQWDGSQPHQPGAELEFIIQGVGGSAEFAADFLALHDHLRPDVSVIDVMHFTTVQAALDRSLPFITLNHLAWNLEGRATGGLGQIAHQHTGYGFFELLDRAPMVLATTYPAFGTADRMPPNVHFVGPIREPVPLASWPRRFPERPFVLVSLSSVFQEQDGTLRNVCQGLSTLPIEVLVTTGRGISPESLPVSGGLEARRFAYSAGAGTPMLVLPNGRVQNDNGARVETLGLGRVMTCDAPPAEIADAVAAILSDREVRTRVKRFANGVERFGDLSGAADLVLRAVARCREPLGDGPVLPIRQGSR